MASKKVVRVHFMDDASRAFAIDENTTAQQLRATIIERLDLKEDGCFALFEKKDGWERCLEPEEKPCELMTLWTEDSLSEKEKKRKQNQTIQMRKSLFVIFHLRLFSKRKSF